MTIINLGDTVEQIIESAGKPAIDEGTYLAIVTNIAPHENEVTGSFGLDFTFQVNTNVESLEDGWDSEARLQEIKQYFWVGKMEAGKVMGDPRATGIGKLLKALNLGTQIDPKEAVGRILKVTIYHTPSQADAAALEDDPTHTVDQYYAKIRYTNPYIKDGIKAPTLPGFESLDDVFVADEPAEVEAAPADAEKPAKKNKKNTEEEF